ncbi:outer membrane protein, cobalt-zinc-cadmium efflux system [Fodinibius roseus]|uniref:Outer membrane protein, cobalt-zinc-cadmium efflux system n=1 Tax=Fodinibius roseus TaxID=1194090 RepID=A0A1M4X4X0_9BACT|nr:TolC family protein [Fodinibius roseus]SHE88413.1 outer membrane protein, cobalt-zinc-cadmium efflux system [Fodinibius roseus]
MIYSLIFALIFSWQAGSADTTDLSSLDVQKALRIAYDQNPRINQLRNKIDAQRQQQLLSIGLRDPELAYLREGVGDNGFSEQRWSVSQTFDFPLTSYYRYKNEQARTGVLERQLEAQKLQLKADVKSAYTELAYAIEISHLAREQVNLFQQLRNAAQTRSDLGESSEIDAMQADLQLSEARNNLETARRQIMNARYDLFETIGLEPEDQRYDISFPDTLHYIAVDIDQEEVLRRLDHHPELKQISRQQRAALLQTKIARASYLPDLSISYYKQDFGNNYDFYGFEVGVSIPLWFGASQSRKVKQAHALQREIDWKFAEQELSLKKRAEQTWHSYQTTRVNIQRFRESIQSKSLELVRMTQKGYQYGELDLLRLLEAQRTYLRTQEAYYQTLRNYYLKVIALEQYLQADIIFK